VERHYRGTSSEVLAKKLQPSTKHFIIVNILISFARWERLSKCLNDVASNHILYKLTLAQG
jgi:hypothetical protein